MATEHPMNSSTQSSQRCTSKLNLDRIDPLGLRLISTRTFSNGNVLLSYTPR